jgi:hypothetical protein
LVGRPAVELHPELAARSHLSGFARLNVSSDLNVLRNIFTASQNFKPYPHGSIQHYSNYGDNSYHGGTWRVEKRYSAGLVMNAFYTFSKSVNNVDNDGGVNGITFYNRAL